MFETTLSFLDVNSVGAIAHIKVLSHLKTQRSLHPVSVPPSLVGIFIVRSIPWRSAVFSWQWTSPNKCPEIGDQFCLQSAPSLLPSPGIFFLLLLPGDITFLHANSRVIQEKRSSQLCCSQLCNFQLWCFCIGPTIPGLVWRTVRSAVTSPALEKQKRANSWEGAGLAFLQRTGKVLRESGHGLVYGW